MKNEDINSEIIKDLIELIKCICKIPSPTRKEYNKALFIQKWLQNVGANCVIDEMNNVIFEHGNDKSPQIAFIAHIDTVYSSDTQFIIHETDDVIKCPSVNDNSANVAAQMIVIKYLLSNNIQFDNYKLIFVFSTCEEALGNSDGCRFFLERYRNVKEVIIVDGDYSSILCDAVGAERYKISVSTSGGHSFRNHTNPNAIHILSSIICDLYSIPPCPESTAISTVNVGVISGGTSVTSIASYAQMQFEFRSNCFICLYYIKKKMFEIINKHKNNDCNIVFELIGSRPCSFNVNKHDQDKILNRVESVYINVLGKSAPRKPRSTDGSISLSMGIPTASISVYKGIGNHSEKEETLYKDSLFDGMRMFLCLVLSYR